MTPCDPFKGQIDGLIASRVHARTTQLSTKPDISISTPSIVQPDQENNAWSVINERYTLP